MVDFFDFLCYNISRRGSFLKGGDRMDDTEKLRQPAFFARLFLYEERTPVYVKIPESVMKPDRTLRIVLEAMNRLYGANCMVVVQEAMDTSDGIKPSGIGICSIEPMLIVTFINGIKFISGIITRYGEFELLCLNETGTLVIPLLEDRVIRAMALRYIDAVTKHRSEWMMAAGYGIFGSDEVYFPDFIHD